MNSSDLRESDAWLIFRLDTQVKDQPVDVFLLMDLPSGTILGFKTILGLTLNPEEAQDLLQGGRDQKGRWPRRVLMGKGDPSEKTIQTALAIHGMNLESVARDHLEPLIAPVKESFGRQFYSPSSFSSVSLRDDVTEDERESARQFMPDSYDPCSCGSRKKFKFCCKPIIGEIIAAMAAAESGHLTEALGWMEKAAAIAGETAEVLCRYAVVYSFTDSKKSDEYLKRCLQLYPNHPRANYLLGIGLKEKGDLKGAVHAYETALSNYPATDKYHRNEVLVNLGSAHFDLGNIREAKAAWEEALMLLPSDTMVRENLMEFIYMNPALPPAEREMSPLIVRFFR